MNKNLFKYKDPISCYWAGFLAADGCIYQSSKNRKGLHFGVKEKEVVQKFIDFCGSDKKPYYNKTAKYFSFSSYSIETQEAIKNLGNNFSITERKTFTLQAPKLDTYEQELSFLLGAIDGDGWMYINKDGYPCIGICGAALDFMKWAEGLFKKYTITKANLRKSSSNSTYSIELKGRASLDLIGHFKTLSVTNMDRKLDKLIRENKFDGVQKVKYNSNFCKEVIDFYLCNNFNRNYISKKFKCSHETITEILLGLRNQCPKEYDYSSIKLRLDKEAKCTGRLSMENLEGIFKDRYTHGLTFNALSTKYHYNPSSLSKIVKGKEYAEATVELRAKYMRKEVREKYTI